MNHKYGFWQETRVVLGLALSSALRALMSWQALVILLIEALVVFDALSPVSTYVTDIGYRVGPWMFVFVANDPVNQLYMALGLLFLLAGAPFATNREPSVVVRAGRFCWASSKVVTICLVSLVYYTVMYGLSLLAALQWTTFHVDGWGVAISSLTSVEVAVQAGFAFSVSPEMISSLDPLSALGLVFLFECVAGLVLGLLVLCVNALTKTRAGLALAAFVVLLDLLVQNVMPYWAFRYSLLSHARIQLLDFAGTSAWYPTPGEAFSFDGVIALVVMIVAFMVLLRMDIDVHEKE